MTTIQTKKLFIFKLGSTWPHTAARFGDFDLWTVDALGPIDVPVEVAEVGHGAALPEHERCSGVIVTGSHAMVTDNHAWSVATERWLELAVHMAIPVLGVCYGHQLLARAMGGHVDYHPQGREIGTVEIHRSPRSTDDALFGAAPPAFLAHVTHAQSVLQLPDAAVHLAGNSFEANQAFRIGECAWGVQFHPEYNSMIMREYISGLSPAIAKAGQDADQIANQVTDTPEAAQILRRFGEIVESGDVNTPPPPTS